MRFFNLGRCRQNLGGTKPNCAKLRYIVAVGTVYGDIVWLGGLRSCTVDKDHNLARIDCAHLMVARENSDNGIMDAALEFRVLDTPGMPLAKRTRFSHGLVAQRLTVDREYCLGALRPHLVAQHELPYLLFAHLAFAGLAAESDGLVDGEA